MSVRVDIISCKKLKIDDVILLTEAFFDLSVSTFFCPSFLQLRKAIAVASTQMVSNISTILIAISITLMVIRILYVMYRTSKPLRTTPSRPLSTLIVLGSGLVMSLPSYHVLIC